jgi:hypothetical protein
MKFEKAVKLIFGVFETPSWVYGTIVPDAVNEVSTNYGKLSILFTRHELNNFISGIVNIAIFSENDKGPLSAILFADALNDFIQNKSFSSDEGTLQFFKSTFIPVGIDPDNNTLYRHQYSIQFNYTGVT